MQGRKNKDASSEAGCSYYDGSKKVEESAVVQFDLAAAAVSIGLIALAALVGISSASAAIAPVETYGTTWKTGSSKVSCEERLSSLYLAGSFVMPGSAEPMQLWIGKPRAVSDSAAPDVLGVIARSSGSGCEAECKVIRFERFKSDLKPALMELDCEGTTIRTMRMPLHIQWARGNGKPQTTVRLGSSIYGVEEAPLHLALNRYAVATAK